MSQNFDLLYVVSGEWLWNTCRHLQTKRFRRKLSQSRCTKCITLKKNFFFL